MCESRIANAEMLLECSLAGDNVYPETAHFPLLDAVSRLGHSNKCYFLGYYSSDYRIYSTDVEICGSSDYPPKSVDHPPRCSMSSWMMPGKSYHTESNIDHTEFESSKKRLYNLINYDELSVSEKAIYNNDRRIWITYTTGVILDDNDFNDRVLSRKRDYLKNPYSNKLGWSIAYESSKASPYLNRAKPWVSSSYSIVIL